MSDEIDLEGLDAYLMSDDSPDDCMMLSDLDGFLHGIVCSPVAIPQAEWLRKAMGGPFDKVPPAIRQSITDIYDNIVEGLALEEPEVEPIFWEAKEGHVIAMDWCEGFMVAAALRPKEWLRLTESAEVSRGSSSRGLELIRNDPMFFRRPSLEPLPMHSTASLLVIAPMPDGRLSNIVT